MFENANFQLFVITSNLLDHRWSARKREVFSLFGPHVCEGKV